ncbi:hypothetical protein ACH5RR_010226 [Cinchona calisaya]|uniref:Uncharacterized protein n=1 Tax=Cinchona calisaya TaxID=153742 RepID=A0ABD3AGW0_9GENT
MGCECDSKSTNPPHGKGQGQSQTAMRVRFEVGNGELSRGPQKSYVAQNGRFTVPQHRNKRLTREMPIWRNGCRVPRTYTYEGVGIETVAVASHHN